MKKKRPKSFFQTLSKELKDMGVSDTFKAGLKKLMKYEKKIRDGKG